MGTPLTELLQNPTALGSVTNAIDQSVRMSFRSHPMRHVTSAEIRRRFEICVGFFRESRQTTPPLSIQRCIDEFPKVLRAKLDGRDYVPHRRTLWTPEDA